VDLQTGSAEDNTEPRSRIKDSEIRCNDYLPFWEYTQAGGNRKYLEFPDKNIV